MPGSSSALQGSPSRSFRRRLRLQEEELDESDDDAAEANLDESEDEEVVAEDLTRTGGAAPPAPPPTYLLPSLFANRPPTVWFDYPPFTELSRELPPRTALVELTDKKLKPLLFRSDKNINCITGAFKRTGFRRLVKGNSFNVYWGHHLKEKGFSKLGPSQHVNHFPGSYGIGRKDYLWKNLSRQLRQHGKAYDFCAKSYLLPRDRELFERDYEEGEVFIVKPPASAEGRGIRLINKLEQAPKGSTQALVQKYIGEPYLIDKKKFDLRIYVLVSSFDPLRAYVFEEGLVRFATSDYVGAKSSNIKNRYMHLTNYSVNKKSQNFVRNTDAKDDAEGSKWSLSAFWRHMAEAGHDVGVLKARIHDIVVKTLISVEHSVVSKSYQQCHNSARPFELFGFDILLDKSLKCWLIEVNVACSLSSSSPLDKHVKHLLMTDIFHLIGVTPFDRRSAKEEDSEKRKARLLRGNPGNTLKKRNIFELQATPLSELPADDLEVIATAEDEARRRGHWHRVLPCAEMGTKYLPYFEFARYNNLILAKWMAKPDWSLLAPLRGGAAPTPAPPPKRAAASADASQRRASTESKSARAAAAAASAAASAAALAGADALRACVSASLAWSAAAASDTSAQAAAAAAAAAAVGPRRLLLRTARSPRPVRLGSLGGARTAPQSPSHRAARRTPRSASPTVLSARARASRQLVPPPARPLIVSDGAAATMDAPPAPPPVRSRAMHHPALPALRVGLEFLKIGTLEPGEM